MLPRNKWINRFAKRSLVALAATSASAGLLDSAFGQNGGTWTYNGNDNWGSATVWFDALIPSGANQLAGFGIGGANPLDTLTVTLETSRTIGSLSFGDGDAVQTPAGWLLKSLGAPQILTLQVDPDLTPGLAVANLGTGDGTSQIGTLFQKVAHISANLAGTQGFNKTGAGTAILSGNNSGLSGSITLTQGALVLDSANALGGVNLLTQRTGQLAFRGDAANNFSGTSIVLQNDATFGSGNTITAGGQYGSGVNLAHTLGNVTIDNYGVRTLGISGSNGYGLNMGLLTLRDGINLINQGDNGSINGAGDNNNVNGLGSGLVTVGSIAYGGTGVTGVGTVNLGGVGSYAGNITVTNAISQTGGGSANLVYSGSKTATLNGAIGLTGDVYVTGGTTGNVASLTFQAGVGTLIVNSGALPSNRALTVNGGTLLLNGGALTHSINGLTMGGATLAIGTTSIPAFINSGAGTLALGGSVIVNDGTIFDQSTTTSSVGATAGVLNGRLDLGGSTRSIAVNGISTLTVGGIVSGTGGIIKSGTGALNLTNANSFTGAIDVVDGVVAGTVQAAGNSLGATAANVSLGGALRLNGIATAGAGTVNTLTSKDSGGNEGLIVDASAGGTTTLNINILGGVNGRETNTRGTIKVVPVTGQLNTREVINLSTGAPATTNGILPAYFAVQNSGTNTQLGFASLSGTRIVSFGGYAIGTVNVNTAANTSIYDQTVTETLTVGKSLAGLRIAGGASLDGAQSLSLNNGASGLGGLIMNGGAMVNVSTLTAGANELVVWSGGTLRNSITSTLNLAGDLTLGGSQALDLTGTLNFNGASKNISVTGSTVTLSGASALNNTGAFVKRGGGVLAIGGTNVTNAGTVGIEGGTLQLGTGGVTGSVGSGAIVNNANLSLNMADLTGNAGGSFGNAVSGTGNLWVNATSTGIVTAAGALTYTGNTTVQSGTLKINGVNRVPTGTAMRVESGATFDLTGFAQSFTSLSGAGTIANTVAGNTTLTVNGGGTFNGSIRNAGAGSLALVKSGNGTLILGGANAFNGTISITGGTLQVNSAGASSSGNGNPNIVLNNAALTINHNANMTNANMFFIGSSTISVISNPPVVLGVEYDGAGAGINSAQNSWQGNGTVNFLLNGRALNLGNSGAAGGNELMLTNFSGTLKFDDSNPVGSRIRMGVAVNNYTSGSTSSTFAFGNGNLLLNHRNGSAIFNMGYVTGGTNTILEGHGNGGGRTQTYNFGFMAGDQTYHGQIRDYNINGGNGIVFMAKYGASSSLTLKNTLAFTGGVTVNAGTLILASGVNVTNSASLILNGGTLSVLPGATFTSPRIITTVGAGALDVNAFGSFPTPTRMTYIGGGTIYGNVNHNAGSINPGAIGGAGTLTFANTLNMNNGSVDFDLTPGSINLLGTSGLGSNDVLQVNAASGLTLSSGIVRLNFLNAGTTPPPTLAVNQVYPIIKYNAAYGGATNNILTVAKFRGSFALVEGVGSLANTLGAKIIALGGPTVNLVWNPVAPDLNAWDAAIGFTNFKPLVGAGSLFFFNGDSVTFDDTTTIRTVQLTPDLAPSSITVNTNNTYILTGQGFGSIVGSTGLVKNGTGTLFLAGNNTFTGGITINGGTLVNGDPFSNGNTRAAFAGGTVVFNNDSDFRFTSPAPNTFSGPDGGTFVFKPGEHRFIIASSNGTHPWNTNFAGNGTVVFERPSNDNNNSNITFQADDWASFGGTIKVNDLTDFLAGSNQQTAFRDGTILRPTGGGSASMILDMGQGQGGLILQGGNQTLTVGALRGGVNTKVKASGNNSAGTFAMVGVGPQYNSTFDGLFKATQGNAVDAPIMLVHVVKGGSLSTLTLTQNQLYVGNTIVNGGTLALVSSSANPLVSPTITIGTGGALNLSGIAPGTFTLNTDQRLISNGTIVGATVQATSTSTVGGTKIDVPLVVETGATISPGNTPTTGGSVGTLTVASLDLGQAQFLIEVDQNGMDTLVLSGTQTSAIVSAISTVNLVNLGGFVPGTYTLLDYTGNSNIQNGIQNGFAVADFAYEVKVVHDSANTRVNLEFVNNSAQWFANANGAWSQPTNWTLNGSTASAIVPNSVTFGTFITAPRTVTVNGTLGNTANSIVFDSPNTYTIAGPGTLSLDSGVVAPITVLQGNHNITATVRALKTLGVSVPTGSTLSFGGTVISANNSGINKIGTGTASFTRLNMPGGTLSVGAGTVIMTTKGAPNDVSGTNLLANISIAAGAKLDLANNATILDYGTLGTILTDLRAELQDGRLFSSTAGAGKRLGYRNNNTGTTPAGVATTPGLGLATGATFAGVATPDNTAVLIRVTYAGDTNLDGIVNVIDLYNLAINWLSTNGVWAGGDFNYDGLVNATDLGLLSSSWQLGNNNPLPADDLGAALTSAGIPQSAVPEPGTLSLVGVGALGLLSRRRRRV